MPPGPPPPTTTTSTSSLVPPLIAAPTANRAPYSSAPLGVVGATAWIGGGGGLGLDNDDGGEAFGDEEEEDIMPGAGPAEPTPLASVSAFDDFGEQRRFIALKQDLRREVDVMLRSRNWPRNVRVEGAGIPEMHPFAQDLTGDDGPVLGLLSIQRRIEEGRYLSFDGFAHDLRLLTSAALSVAPASDPPNPLRLLAEHFDSFAEERLRRLADALAQRAAAAAAAAVVAVRVGSGR